MDVDEDVQTFEIDSMTDQEIIDRVRAVDDENDEDDNIEQIDQNERITEPPIKSEKIYDRENIRNIVVTEKTTIFDHKLF